MLMRCIQAHTTSVLGESSPIVPVGAIVDDTDQLYAEAPHFFEEVVPTMVSRPADMPGKKGRGR